MLEMNPTDDHDQTAAASPPQPADAAPPPSAPRPPGSALPALALLAAAGASVGLALGLGTSALLGALVLPLLCAVGLAVTGGRRSFSDRLWRLAAFASPAVAAAALPALLSWRNFAGEPLLLGLTVLPLGLLLERTSRLACGAVNAAASLDAPQAPSERTAMPSRNIPLLATFILALAAGLWFSLETVVQHAKLATNTFDLAVVDNMMWNLLHGNGFVSTPLFGAEESRLAHHTPFLSLLFLPFYALRPRAETLLILQGILAGFAAVPLFLYVRQVLGSGWIALALSSLYLIFAPLHGAVFYDFHELTLAPFFVFTVLYLFEAGRPRDFALALATALLLREDVSLGLAGFFLFAALTGRRRSWSRPALVVCLASYAAMRGLVMPRFASPTSGGHLNLYFGGLLPEGGAGGGAAMASILANPVHVLRTLVTAPKAAFLLSLLVPFLFLPFRLRRGWILLLSGLGTLLATRPSVTDIAFQYSSHWTPYLFAGTVLALESWGRHDEGRRRTRAALLALFFAGAAMSYHQGALFQRNTFRSGYRTVDFAMTAGDVARAADLGALIALIPPDASVAATDHEGPHVSNRRRCYAAALGLQQAEYLLLEATTARATLRRRLAEALAAGDYGLVAVRGTHLLWRRGHDAQGNLAGLRLLGLGPRTSPTRRSYREFSTPLPDGAPGDAPGTVGVLDENLAVEMEGPSHAAILGVSADADDDYLLIFQQGDRAIGQAMVPALPGREGLALRAVAAPEEVRRMGFDRLLICPAVARGPATVGAVIILAGEPESPPEALPGAGSRPAQRDR